MTWVEDYFPAGTEASTPNEPSMGEDLKIGSGDPAVVGDVVHVVVKLVDGDRVLAGSFAEPNEAHALAKELQSGFGDRSNSWPLVEGRYLRPQAVVSIDLVEEEHRRWGGSSERAKVKGRAGALRDTAA
jgi:hypothetical protein